MVRELRKKLNIKNVSPELVAIYAYKYCHHLISKPTHPRVILAIVGCQRSGTSLLTRVFARDINAKVYRETSILSSDDPMLYDAKRLRLNSLTKLQHTFAKDRPPLIVLKPLVESHNILEILDFFSEARAMWVYRHYLDVANSNVGTFGRDASIRDLKPIVDEQPLNWRSEYVSDETRTLIRTHYKPDLNPYDAAALFWYARNQIYFDLNLFSNKHVLLVRYDDFADSPDAVMKKTYRFLGLPYPGEQITSEVHSRAINKGRQTILSPEIDEACQDMWKRLNHIYCQDANANGSIN